MAYDFPSSPTIGQVVNGYTWNGQAWTGTYTGLPDAPADGKIYARGNNAWTETGTKVLIDSKADAVATTAALSGKVSKAGDRMTGALVVNQGDPPAPAYVTSIISGCTTVLSGLAFNTYINAAGNGWVTHSAGWSGAWIQEPTTGMVGWYSTGGSSGAGVAASFALKLSIAPDGMLTANGGVNSGADAGFQIPARYAAFTSTVSDTMIQFEGAAASINYSKGTGTYLFAVGGVNRMILYNTGSLYVSNANAAKPGGGVWNDSSDARIKDVLGDYTSGLGAILALQPKRFTYKGNDTPGDPESIETEAPHAKLETASLPYSNSPHYQTALDGTEFVGLIAQDVEAVFPEMVTLRPGQIDGVAVDDIRNLDTSPLVFALVNAVKELKLQNDQLHDRIKALEAANGL